MQVRALSTSHHLLAKRPPIHIGDLLRGHRRERPELICKFPLLVSLSGELVIAVEIQRSRPRSTTHSHRVGNPRIGIDPSTLFARTPGSSSSTHCKLGKGIQSFSADFTTSSQGGYRQGWWECTAARGIDGRERRGWNEKVNDTEGRKWEMREWMGMQCLTSPRRC